MDLLYSFNGTVAAMRDSSAGVSYLHGDHLGSVSATSGAQAGGQTYGPWGNVTSGSSSATARNYTGQYLDSASGLLYYHARYYDAVLARFISADSVVPGQTATTGTPNPQQLNRYSYVGNNPLTYNDPSGRCFWDLCLVEGAAAYAALTAVLTAATYVGIQIYNIQNPINVENPTPPEDSDTSAPPEAGTTSTPGTDEAGEDPSVAPAPKGGTYVLKDPETGEIMRTGQSGDLARRQKKEHAKKYPDLDFDVDARTDDYAERRGREEYLHQKYNPPLDKQNAIDPKNPKRQEYVDAAKNVKGKY